MNTQSVYILIRIRKSGSSSLEQMLRSALPESKVYGMPHDPPVADLGLGFFEWFRRIRRTKKRLWKTFKTTSYSSAWAHLNREVKSGDIISGHIRYDSVMMPDWKLNYITIMRDPVERLYSDYRYSRQSYFKRPTWRRFYLAARLKVAGRGNFSEYVSYLVSHGNRFANPYVGYITGSCDHENPYDFIKKNFFHYGILENIEKFAQDLSYKIGLKIDPIWNNATKKTGNLMNEEYDHSAVNRLLNLDIQLYNKIRNEIETTQS